ncbi:MAG: hypothetical protein KDD60_08180 [Bdellovibrionales bacterium]|nr:hypothetical protein [Bdellovibrionales bacterium]
MTTNKPTIALLGGGYTLTRLAHILPKSDFVFTARSNDKIAALHRAGYFAKNVDTADRDSLNQLFSEYQHIHTLIDSVPPFSGDNPLLGIQNTLAALPSSISRIFYLSTTGVYGVTDGSWVTEETAPLPLNESGTNRYQSELLYAKAHPEVTCLRLSGIYGPGRGIGIRLQNGSYTLLEDGTRWTNRIHVVDIINILRLGLAATTPLPPALNISDNLPAPMHEVVEFYCNEFHFAFPQQVTIEKALAENRTRLLLNQRISNDLVRKTLNYDFRYPTYREGANTEFERANSSAP